MAGRRIALAAVLALPVLLAPTASAASCAGPADPVLLDSELVFAGEVSGTANDGRVADVRVLDVWHGRDLPPEVTVVGGPGDADSLTSVDRVFEEGTTYAFFAYEDEEGVLRDNACTPTARLTERADLDPPGVRAPRADAPAPVDPRTPPWMWLAGGGAVLGAGALALVMRRRSPR